VRFEDIIEKVIADEGGYVNDPDDAGGETKWGISKRSFPDINIKELTRKEAISIYERFYWIPSKAEKLPSDIRAVYFEMVVNMGQPSAVRILQRACNGAGAKIGVDGRIGAMTVGASQKVSTERLVSYQVLFYAQLVTRKPDQEKFWFGWFMRAVEDITM
jgi:lysozyme family protein